MTCPGSSLLTSQLLDFTHQGLPRRNPETPLHAFRKFTLRTLCPSRVTHLNSAKPSRPLALPRTATIPQRGRMRLAEPGATDPPLQLLVPASATPRISFLPASRPGLLRPVASRLSEATARTLPWSPSPLSHGAPLLPRPPRWGRPGRVGTWTARRPRQRGRCPRRGRKVGRERLGGEAGTHLSPARSVFGPVSSAASPAPPHPPQQEVTSSAAFVTSILSGEGGGGGGALPPVSQPCRAAPSRVSLSLLLSADADFRPHPAPGARSSRRAARAATPARRVRHAAGARYARSWRAAGRGVRGAREPQLSRGQEGLADRTGEGPYAGITPPLDR